VGDTSRFVPWPLTLVPSRTYNLAAVGTAAAAWPNGYGQLQETPPPSHRI